MPEETYSLTMLRYMAKQLESEIFELERLNKVLYDATECVMELCAYISRKQ